MRALVRGERNRLADLRIGGPFDAAVALALPGAEVDLSVFGLGTAGRLSDDRYLIFYNQPASPCGAVRLISGGANTGCFTIDLGRMPPSIAQLTVAGAVDGAATLGQGTGGAPALERRRRG